MKDISIIIPIYNKEKTLSRCIDSVLHQSYALESMEIICVNDGSLDRSTELLKKYERKGVIVINNDKNLGVSRTRNIGIKRATGRYILFLDADDYISENTIHDIIVFFDEIKEEVDIVTYNIYTVNGRKINQGKRGIKYTKNCIIDLRENPDFSQTTMNICIKNNMNIFFDENFSLAEDQLFNTNVVKAKAKIGWCATAAYYYDRDHSTSPSANITYYSLESFVNFFLVLVRIAKCNPHFSNYCYSLILYNINWRINSDNFFPYHKNGGICKPDERVVSIIKDIDSSLIVRNQWLSIDLKAYLISFKTNISVAVRDNFFYLYENDNLIFSDDVFDIVILGEKAFNSIIKFSGCFKGFFLNFVEKIQLYILINGVEREVKLNKTADPVSNIRCEINKYYFFEVEIDLIENFTISFYAIYNNIKFKTKIQYKNWYNKDRMDSLHYFINEIFKVDVTNNFIKISKTKFSIASFWNYLCCTNLSVIKRIIIFFIRLVTKFIKNNLKIWLYYIDGSVDDDDVMYQFLHDTLKNDGIIRFYVVTIKNLARQEKYNIRKRFFFVKKGSFLHQLIFISSEILFTTSFEANNFIPIKKSFFLYRDLITLQCIYFPNKDIITPFTKKQAKEFLYFIDKIIISNIAETQIAYKELHFSNKDILRFGLPRFSGIKKSSRPTERKILYAPCWELYLSKLNIKNINDPFLIDTIKQLVSPFACDRLMQILKTYGLTLDVFIGTNEFIPAILHGILEDVNFIKESDYNNYFILITDYSKIFYYFMYMNRNIVQYFPFNNFIKDVYHIYYKFLYPYFNAYVQTAFDLYSLSNIILQLCKNNFTPLFPSKFFLTNIDHSTDNIYSYSINRFLLS